MKLKYYLDSLGIIARRAAIDIRDLAPLSTPVVPADGSEHVTKHCILIHGWASDARAMRHVREALRKLPQSAGRRFWDVTYDTAWTPFPASAKSIVRELYTREHDFSRTLLIGYSMGGLIARQMVAEGFPCDALVTLCTPHHGPLRWVPVPLRGPRSLATWSRVTAALNRHPQDIAARHKYHLFAVTYRDRFGFHGHDGMVTQSSALGLKLGEVASRKTMHLKYSVPISAIMPFDPHWRAMFPHYIPPAIRHIGGLLEEF